MLVSNSHYNAAGIRDSDWKSSDGPASSDPVDSYASRAPSEPTVQETGGWYFRVNLALSWKLKISFERRVHNNCLNNRYIVLLHVSAILRYDIFLLFFFLIWSSSINYIISRNGCI